MKNVTLNLGGTYTEVYKNSEYTTENLEGKAKRIKEIIKDATGVNLAGKINPKYKINETLEKAKLSYDIEKSKRNLPKQQIRMKNSFKPNDLGIQISTPNKRSMDVGNDNKRWIKLAKNDDNASDDGEPEPHEVLELHMRDGE